MPSFHQGSDTTAPEDIDRGPEIFHAIEREVETLLIPPLNFGTHTELAESIA